MLAKHLHALEVEHEGVSGSSEPFGVDVFASEEPEAVDVLKSSPVDGVSFWLLVTRVLDFSTHDSVSERK